MSRRDGLILLRIFLDEYAMCKFGHQDLPLYEALICKARDMQITRAVAWRGLAGFTDGSGIDRGRLRTRPIIVEIIDLRLKIETFVHFLDEMGISSFIISDVHTSTLSTGAYRDAYS